MIHDFDPSWDFDPKPTKPAPSYWEWADADQRRRDERNPQWPRRVMDRILANSVGKPPFVFNTTKEPR
jgi:hypothetical protein